MPVPGSGIIGADDIYNGVVEGGATPADYSFANMRSAATLSKFSDDWDEGAAALSDIKKFSQWRNYPVPPPLSFGNAEKSQTFQKSCSGGATGSYVTYTIPANTYWGVTQVDADNLALADIAANGQNNANANGYCTWYSDEMGQSFTKECGSGYTGSSHYFQINAGAYSSGVSKDEANGYAYAALQLQGQSNANNIGTCTPNCTEWGNTGSPYCNGVNSWMQDQTRVCGVSSEYRSVTLEVNSCNCVGWSNSGSAYCSGSNWVQNQYKDCGGATQYQTVTLEVNSCNCVGWSDTGSPYCSGSDKVQGQYRNCGGSTQNRTWIVESSSCDCIGWVNSGAPYCSEDGNKYQPQHRTCSGGYHTRTIVGEYGSCDCIGWSNINSPYCSGNNLVQDQYRYCNGQGHNQTIVVEYGSSGCTSCQQPSFSISLQGYYQSYSRYTVTVDNYNGTQSYGAWCNGVEGTAYVDSDDANGTFTIRTAPYDYISVYVMFYNNGVCPDSNVVSQDIGRLQGVPIIHGTPNVQTNGGRPNATLTGACPSGGTLTWSTGSTGSPLYVTGGPTYCAWCLGASGGSYSACVNS